jgi:hypothetical protein
MKPLENLILAVCHSALIFLSSSSHPKFSMLSPRTSGVTQEVDMEPDSRTNQSLF